MKPWEKYQQTQGPWTKYQQPAQPEPERITVPPENVFEAGLYSFGHEVLRLGAGAEVLARKAGGLMGIGEPSKLAEAKATQAQLGREHGELLHEHPIAGTVGSVAPFLAMPQAMVSSLARAAATGGGLGLVGSGGDPLAAGLGAGAGGLGYGAGRLLAGSGTGLNPVQQATVQRGEQLGYYTPPATATGSRSLQVMEAGFRSNPITANIVNRALEGNQELLNKHALTALGEKGTRFAEDTLEQASRRIGGAFDDVARQTTARVDDTLEAQLGKIQDEAMEAIIDESQQKALTKYLDQFWNKVDQNAVISGPNLQSVSKRWRQKASDLWKNPQADKDLARGLSAASEALDDFMERSAPASVVDKLRKARSQWRTFKDLDRPNMVKGGNVSPNLLRNQLARTRTQFRRGEPRTPVEAGARHLTTFPPQFGSSGTTERLLAGGGLLGAGGLGGGMYGQDLDTALAAGASALALPWLAARGYYGAPGRWLTRQTSPAARALAGGTGARIGLGTGLGGLNPIGQ